MKKKIKFFIIILVYQSWKQITSVTSLLSLCRISDILCNFLVITKSLGKDSVLLSTIDWCDSEPGPDLKDSFINL